MPYAGRDVPLTIPLFDCCIWVRYPITDIFCFCCWYLYPQNSHDATTIPQPALFWTINPCIKRRLSTLNGPVDSKLMIVEFLGILLFDHEHQLENTFHPPYACFDNQRATPASCETFPSTLLVTRMIGCVPMERTVAELMPVLLKEGGGYCILSG